MRQQLLKWMQLSPGSPPRSVRSWRSYDLCRRKFRSWSRQTEELEQFVEGLKPDGKDPVVRRDEHYLALGVMETTQTLAEELKARVDELTGFKAQVDSVVARVPDDRQSPWIQGLSLELEQRVQEDVQRSLDATLKEYRRERYRCGVFVLMEQAGTGTNC